MSGHSVWDGGAAWQIRLAPLQMGEDCPPRRSVAKAGGEGISNSDLVTVEETLTLPSPLFKGEAEPSHELQKPQPC